MIHNPFSYTLSQHPLHCQESLLRAVGRIEWVKKVCIIATKRHRDYLKMARNW